MGILPLRAAMLRALLVSSISFSLAACTSAPGTDGSTDGSDATSLDVQGDSTPSDASPDAIVDGASCRTDQDCTDGIYCNGAERCMPGAANADARGCAPPASATPCMATQTCDESMRRCLTECDRTGDADNDGHRAMNCGGDDCDDADAERFPGHAEVCDTRDHDEDCDANTFGVRDSDNDNSPDRACCNVANDGTRHCGDDCDDMRAGVNPRATETCDNLDNDCDGMTDEGVLQTYYVDADNDGAGSSDPGAMTQHACSPPPGFVASHADCDDANPNRNNTAPEVCDGVDNDCDGMVDEGVTRRFFHDADGDSYGDPDTMMTMQGCNPPANYVENNTDCDDTNAGRNPGAPEVCDGVDNDCDGMTDEAVDRIFFRDADGDGFGSSNPMAMTSRGCAPPAGYSPNNIDCDDTNAGRNPASPEICDGVDNDCDGMTDEGAGRNFYPDMDGDGFGARGGTPRVACSPPASYVENSADCDDTAASRNPGAPEVCDGLDNDCDGSTDEGVSQTFYTDADGDGYGSSDPAAMTRQACSRPAGFSPNNIDCDDTNRNRNPGAPEVCDLVDNNCDGTTDNGVQITYYRDADGDGFGSSAVGAMTAQACSPPAGYASNAIDCDDTNRARNPSAPEVCDGVDNDCDGMTDEGVTRTFYRDADGDGYGSSAAGMSMSACAPPAGYVENNLDCDDTNRSRNPGSAEVCDGVDNDCDSMVDEGVTRSFYRDADGDRFGSATASTMTACVAPAGYVENNSDCDDMTSARNPGAPEICDGLDNDCDTMVDEGVTRTYYRDADSDGYGTRDTTMTRTACVAPAGYVENSTDCDDTAATAHPGGVEICDLLDNDCNGVVNDGLNRPYYPDGDGDGYGRSGSTATMACAAPAGQVPNNSDCDDTRANVSPSGAEVCDGLDNNCNGTTDEGVLRRFYRDADGDRFGASTGTPMMGCNPVAGYVEDSSDCDDTRANVHPGLLEICDGLDNECNGTTDDSAPATASCGTGVNGTMSCTGGACTLSCNGGYADCDGAYTNGCEAVLATSPTNCGSCGNACGIGGVCTTGSCTQITALAAGGEHTCAQRANNTVVCWGGGTHGQLGNGMFSDSLVPVLVGSVPANFTGLSAEASGNLGDGNCGVTNNGGPSNRVVCWGFNSYGQLGDGTQVDRASLVYTSTGASNIVFAATVGDEHTCSFGLDSSFQGAVYCWGRQLEGQIGNGYVYPGAGGSPGPVFTPFRVPMPAGYTASAVEAGNEFACAIVSSTTVTNGVACWGRNFEGQLGRGTMTPSTTVSNATSAIIAGFTNASQLALGYDTACAIKSDGTVWCWGRRYASTPAQVAGLTNVAQLAIGANHICARRGDNSIVCFGDNSGGQLGDGTTLARTGLVTPTGLTAVSTVAAGWAHTCARRATDGRILCWGGNSNGQIGDSMPGVNRLAPFVVPNLP